MIDDTTRLLELLDKKVNEAESKDGIEAKIMYSFNDVMLFEIERGVTPSELKNKFQVTYSNEERKDIEFIVTVVNKLQGGIKKLAQEDIDAFGIDMNNPEGSINDLISTYMQSLRRIAR